jgi:uncharacterized membrane protein YccC
MKTRTSQTLLTLLRGIGGFDGSQVLLPRALRNAIGVTIPLAVGAATGQLLVGLTISIGALQAAFSDQPGPYSWRARAMLLVGLAGALSVFAGSAAGGILWLVIALTLLWGFVAGIMVALGQVATQVGLASVVLLLVFSTLPDQLAHAAGVAAWVLAGAALQAALAVLAWPVRPFAPQCRALASVFRELAAAARTPTSATFAPPATSATIEASQALGNSASALTASGEALRGLLDEAERIRLTLIALMSWHVEPAAPGDAAAIDAAHAASQTVVCAAADVLDALAAALLARSRTSPDPDSLLAPLERALDQVRTPEAEDALPAARGAVAGVRAQMERLERELRTAAELVAALSGDAAGAAPTHRGWAKRLFRYGSVVHPSAYLLRDPLATLGANLTLRSAACRHGARLAACLGIAVLLADATHVPRGYWLPLTVAIVLKPDFTATFVRGIRRMLGTLIGLLLTTGLVYLVFGELPGRIALVAVLVFFIRSVGPANFALLDIGVSGLVVVLTSFEGVRPETAILARGIDTTIGGVLALVAYLVWPTWERSQTPQLLAHMLRVYRRYFDTVMADYLAPEPSDTGRHRHLARLRQDARLARTNAEASLSRLAAEPASPREAIECYQGVLASANRFVTAAMALEALLLDRGASSAGEVSSTLAAFVRDVDGALDRIAETLSSTDGKLGRIPDLGADVHALWDAVIQASECHSQAAAWLALMALQCDRLTEAVNSMADLLGRGTGARAEAA